MKLINFAGKKLVLHFYPKNSTPGCTAEACDLRDNYQRFIAKHELPHLIADTDLSILKAYEAWDEKKMYGKVNTKAHTTQLLK